MNLFECTPKSNNGGVELTVTCDSEFANVTVSCSDGLKTLLKTCPSSSPYTVTFNIPSSGDWVVSATIDSIQYSSDPISIILPSYTSVLVYKFIWQEWVKKSSRLDLTNYSTLADLLSDEEAVRELCLEHNCVDYLYTT